MPVTPLQAATDVLDRADILLLLDAPPQADDVRTDVRRLAWAMGVAAIDTYLHWLVHKVDLDGTLPRDLSKLDVSFADLVDMGKISVAARVAGKRDRPATRARNALHARILRETFQSERGVEKALRFAGISGYWRDLSSHLGETALELRQHLNALANRRNSVVHEGDIQRMSRPHAIKRNELSPADVREELDWVRRFVDGLAHVAP